MEFSTFGRHVAVDTWGVDFDMLNDTAFLEAKMVEAAEISGATVLGTQHFKFEPQGATILVMLSESHITIHTYPEKGFAALDCYTCGETVDPQVAIDHMISVLQPSETYSRALKRGTGPITDLKKPGFLNALATKVQQFLDRLVTRESSVRQLGLER